MDTENYIGRLYEHAQGEIGSCLQFEDLDSDQNGVFTQRVVLNGKAYPEGVGTTKKEARRSAAKNALKCLDSVSSAKNAAEASTSPVTSYVCWLNEYCLGNSVTLRAVESIRFGPNNTTICCSFVVGDEEYPAATAETKKEAKEEAAKHVYDVICGSKTTETADENYNRIVTQQKEELNGLDVRFFSKLVINNKEYPEAEGTTVKEAKQNAARLAWSSLQQQSHSKVSVRSTSSMDAPPSFSAPSASLESHETPSQSMTMGTSASGVFTDSSNSSMDQHAVKNKNMGKKFK